MVYSTNALLIRYHFSSVYLLIQIIIAAVITVEGKVLSISVGTPEVEVAKISSNTYILLKFPTKDTNSDHFNSLHNKTVVFIGDSLTRYQYLNLAYFAVHQHWPPHFDPLCREIAFDRKDRPRFPPEQESDGWKKFNEYSNSVLSDFELCECYREKRWWLHKDSIIENRYLYVPQVGLKMFYIAW